MPKDDYALGYQDKILTYLASRTAERVARFARPYVQDGITLLDCGCGPGSVTVGLAEWAGSGHVTGIDLMDAQWGIGKARAAEKGLTNIDFVKGDLNVMPFEANSFDMVFMRYVLLHTREPHLILSEIMRVLKPGGVLAASEVVLSMFVERPRAAPSHAAMQCVLAKRLRQMDCDPDIGLRLADHAHKAGFYIEHTKMGIEQFETPCDRIDLIEPYLALTGPGSDLRTLAVKKGWATEAEFEAYARDRRRLMADPRTLFGALDVQLIARKPLS